MLVHTEHNYNYFLFRLIGTVFTNIIELFQLILKYCLISDRRVFSIRFITIVNIKVNSNHILIADPHSTSSAIDLFIKTNLFEKMDKHSVTIIWMYLNITQHALSIPLSIFCSFPKLENSLRIKIILAYNQLHWFGYSEILILGKLLFLLSDTLLSVLNLIWRDCFCSAECCKHPLYSWITIKSVTMEFTEITRMTESNKILMLNIRNKWQIEGIKREWTLQLHSNNLITWND